MFRTFSLVSAALGAILGLLVGWSREAQRTRAEGHGPDRAGGRVERCVTCHVKESEDPGGAHVRAALGCSSCHLGNPLAYGKGRAHDGLEKEPGALATVSLTCGREGCHAREAARAASSPMARASGIVSVDRFAFGEIAAPDGAETMSDVLAASRPTPAQSHLRKLCAGCHLGTRRANRDDAIHGNGSGCSACHVARLKRGDPPRPHPPVDARVGDDRCLGCHSRSGRIALSYEGLAEIEAFQAAGRDAACAATGGLVSLHDGRPACRVAPDVHRTAGMACIDCHLHTDLMGDGSARGHKEDQVEITCEACHGPVREGGEKKWSEVEDEISREIRKREMRNREVRDIEVREGETRNAGVRNGEIADRGIRDGGIRDAGVRNEDLLRKGKSGGAPDSAAWLERSASHDGIPSSRSLSGAGDPDAPTRLGRRGTPLLNLQSKSSSSSSSPASSRSSSAAHSSSLSPSPSPSPSPSGWTLIRKLDGVALSVKQTPRDANYARKGHERLSCSACHAVWAPTCDSCHTSFDPARRQWDFAAGRETAGAWVERSEGFSWAPPLLGARADGKIVPAVPGMVLDIDATATGGGKSSRRLLAPVEPHTTGKRARTCESCHRTPAAPEFEGGTRAGFRPLDAAERRRVASARLSAR